RIAGGNTPWGKRSEAATELVAASGRWGRGGPGRTRGPPRTRSLQGDGGAGSLEGLLGLVRRVLGDLLQDRLGRTLDEVLGLLQAEGGQGAHLLDDVDLLVAGSLQDDVELVLGGGVVATGGGATSGTRGRGHG